MELNYFIIPLITVGVAFIGSRLTSGGMKWYQTIKLPSWTPPGSMIGLVWTAIFILSAISAMIVWNSSPRDSRFWWVVALFLVNAALNVCWSYLFFNRHLVGAAATEAATLGLTVVALIILIWPLSRTAAALLLPYAAWVAFATYLTSIIWRLN